MAMRMILISAPPGGKPVAVGEVVTHLPRKKGTLIYIVSLSRMQFVVFLPQEEEVI